MDPLPVINWDFLQSQSLTSFSRTSNATMFDSTGKLTYAPNNLLVSTATLSTQTVTTGLQAGMNVILSFYGTGSITVSGGYSGTLSGTGVSNRVYLAFTTTTASLTFTVSGSVTSAQLEAVTYQTTPSAYVYNTTTPTSQYYGPRYPYAYNGSTWDAQGLLVEAAGTNLATYSEAFDNAAWTKHLTAVAVDANQATSPDGTTSADTLRFNSSGTNLFLLYNSSAFTVTNGATYSVSIFVKAIAGGVGFAAIAANITGDYRYSLCLNLSDGSVSNLGSSTTAANYSVTSVGNGWWRVSIKGTSSNTTAYIEVWPRLTAGAPNTNITVASGDVNKGLYIWGAQLEAGDLSSYIPNLATGTATRNADTSLAFSAISLPTGLSFSRTSNATQYDAAGRLTYAPNNLLLQSNTFSNAAWTKPAGVTLTTGVADPFGGTNATTFSVTTAGSKEIYQTVSGISTTTKAMSTIWMRRRTGSGTIYFQPPDSSANITVTLTSSWQQFALTSFGGGGSPSYLDFTITTNGDEIDVYAPTLSLVTYETVPRPCDQVITTTTAYYGPRYDYDPTTRLPKGLLVEEARTNVLTYSNDASNAEWTAYQASKSGYTVTAPNGVSSMLTFTSSGTTSEVFNATQFTSANNTVYCSSYFVKAGTCPAAVIGLQLSANGGASAVFDLTTGATSLTAVQTYAASGYTIVGAGGQLVGNGIYRLWIAAKSTSVTLGYAYLGQAKTSGNTFTLPGEVANAVSGQTLHVWGWQVETGAFPTSYIPTTSASVQRTADVATLTGTASTIASASDGTLLIETDALKVGSADQILFGNALKDQLYRVVVGGSANVVSNYQFRTSGSGSSNTATWTAPVRASVSYSANAISICLQGGTVATGSGSIAMSGSTYVGSDGSGGQFINGYVRKIGMWNVKISDASLKTKSVVGATL